MTKAVGNTIKFDKWRENPVQLRQGRFIWRLIFYALPRCYRVVDQKMGVASSVFLHSGSDYGGEKRRSRRPNLGATRICISSVGQRDFAFSSKCHVQSILRMNIDSLDRVKIYVQ